VRSQGALFPGAPAATFTAGEATETALEETLAAYQRLVDQAPQHPEPATLFRNSEDAAVTYRTFVTAHTYYKGYLEHLHAAEMALLGLAQRTPAKPATAGADAAPNLPGRVRTAVSRRRDQLGLLFLDEIDSVAGAARQREGSQLAPLLGEAPGTRPLTPEELAALSGGQLEDRAAGITTIRNRLDQVQGLSIPKSPDGTVGGVFRVAGTVESAFLLITDIPLLTIAESENVLVGRTGQVTRVFSSAGEYNRVSVVPLNAAAVTRLGGAGTRSVPDFTLRPIQLRDLSPPAAPVQGTRP
jgi:hypothetical protein